MGDLRKNILQTDFEKKKVKNVPGETFLHWKKKIYILKKILKSDFL